MCTYVKSSIKDRMGEKNNAFLFMENSGSASKSSSIQ